MNDLTYKDRVIPGDDVQAAVESLQSAHLPPVFTAAQLGDALGLPVASVRRYLDRTEADGSIVVDRYPPYANFYTLVTP